MFISQTSKNAIRILSFLARSEQRYSTDYIARELGLSVKNVRKILFLLLKAGFVGSVQGKTGGYYLAGKPQDIYLRDIIDAIDGLDKYDECIFGYEKCNEQNPCPLHYEWMGIKSKFMDFIASINLQKIIDNEHSLNKNIK